MYKSHLYAGNILARPSLRLAFAADKSLPGIVTFTRASSGTYFDASGVMQTASTDVARFTHGDFKTNLLTYSEEFDNAAWTKFNSTISANATVAPDGTTTADKFIEDSGTVIPQIYSIGDATSNLSHALTIFAKAGERDFLVINNNDGVGSYRAWFNLSTGTIGTVDSGLTAEIEDVGGGWYRCSATNTISNFSNSLAGFQVAPSDGVQSYTGDGTSGIYIWGAQLEAGSTASTYIPTTSAAVTRGTSLGLLIEESRTNLLTYSEEFDNAAWTKTANGTGINASVTPNDAVAPDGTTTADLLVLDRGAGNTLSDSSALLSAAVSFTSGVTYSSAVYFKAATVADIGKEIGFRHAGASAYTVIALTSSWVRYDASELAGITFSGNLEISNRGGVTADNTVSAHIWGAQLEAGSFPTSYIKTTSSAATRAADSASITGSNFSDWYNAVEGAFIFSGANLGGTVSFPIPLIASDGTDSNRVQFYLNKSSGRYSAFMVSGGVSQADVSPAGTPAQGAGFNIAASFKTNSVQCSLDGVLGTEDTSCTMPSGINQLGIGNRSYSTTQAWSGTIASISYYPTRLSNSYLQYLTS